MLAGLFGECRGAKRVLKHHDVVAQSPEHLGLGHNVTQALVTFTAFKDTPPLRKHALEVFADARLAEVDAVKKQFEGQGFPTQGVVGDDQEQIQCECTLFDGEIGFFPIPDFQSIFCSRNEQLVVVGSCLHRSFFVSERLGRFRQIAYLNNIYKVRLPLKSGVLSPC
jgi:hypothetical protein